MIGVFNFISTELYTIISPLLVISNTAVVIVLSTFFDQNGIDLLVGGLGMPCGNAPICDALSKSYACLNDIVNICVLGL